MLCAALIAVAQIPAKVEYVRYTNPRFGYTMEIPKFLVAQRDPDNGDGRTWTTKDKKVEVRVWGEANSMGSTLRKEYENEKDILRYGVITVRRDEFKPHFFAFSIEQQEEVIHIRKWAVGDPKKPTGFVSLEFRFMNESRKSMNPIVERVTQSMRLAPKP